MSTAPKGPLAKVQGSARLHLEGPAAPGKPKRPCPGLGIGGQLGTPSAAAPKPWGLRPPADCKPRGKD
eukprot:9894932-Alexandrium_andersonii.AAC.1